MFSPLLTWQLSEGDIFAEGGSISFRRRWVNYNPAVILQLRVQSICLHEQHFCPALLHGLYWLFRPLNQLLPNGLVTEYRVAQQLLQASGTVPVGWSLRGKGNRRFQQMRADFPLSFKLQVLIEQVDVFAGLTIHVQSSLEANAAKHRVDAGFPFRLNAKPLAISLLKDDSTSPALSSSRRRRLPAFYATSIAQALSLCGNVCGKVLHRSFPSWFVFWGKFTLPREKLFFYVRLFQSLPPRKKTKKIRV